MLEIKHATKCFGNLVAVDHISFSLNKGEIYGLLGSNGSGKTTTFRMILSLYEPDDGEVLWNEKKVNSKMLDNIGYLPEERSLLPNEKVIEQIKFFAGLKGMKVNKELDIKIDEWLDYMQITKYKNYKIKELSKGNQQKVQFIIAVLHDPELVILDEAFSGLDPVNSELLKKAILRLQAEGKMILFSSHRMEHVESFCNQIMILVNGESVISGNVLEIKKASSKRKLHIDADIEVDKIMQIEGVLSYSKDETGYIFDITNDEVKNDVFKLMSKCKDVKRFAIELPTLNDIFIERVGEAYHE